MHAVLIEADTSGQADREAGLKYPREQIVPGVSQAPALQARYWPRALEDDRGTSVVAFDTKENADAASQGLSVASSPAPGVTVVRREAREVAASA